MMRIAPLLPGSFTYSNLGGGAWVGAGVEATFDFSISDMDGGVDPRLPEKASLSMRGKKRDLDGVVGRGFCTKFGVERAGTGGLFAGDSLRESGLVGARPGWERLRVRSREEGVGGGDGEAVPTSSGEVLALSWKTSITDHLLRLRVVLLLPLLCDTDSEVRGREESSIG